MRQREHCYKQYEYDIYISMDDGNELLLRWMLHRFCPALKKHGYKVYFPPRDMSVGCFREESIRKTIERSRCVIGFITLSFAREIDEWMALEWRIAWQKYISVYDRKLICINYDQLRYRDIEWPILQKFLRWGTCI
ncbi:hypothetical protein FSP39_011273 [Pinctada imbricata]|uniref:TIR domain-containing protein n=1 Tax=Pinctada imbricata TaxID=66713 RepID=A0AA88XD54_PINIB|nr:hypothetical protein FSP39_011273 [Pinctada imbricata]